MQELIIRDVRLLGGKPRGNEVLEVDENTPIDWPVAWTKSRSEAYGGDVYLRIAAHGFETAVANHLPLATGSRTVAESISYSQGGGGILFCRENITLGTLNRFGLIHALLKGIDLLACGAAYITPGFEGREGDGNVLCSRLAQITGTFVRASTATQAYYGEPAIDFGEWEGTVLTYGPTGAVVKSEHGAGVPTSCPVR